MEPIAIVLLIAGIALLVLSCFLPERKEPETKLDEVVARLAKREITEEEKENLRFTVDQIVSEKTEEVIQRTDDYLSRVANEKIMSVDEYAKQVMERLDKNNSDAMFLYHMLNESKEELKQEVAEAKRLSERVGRSEEAKNPPDAVRSTEKAENKEPDRRKKREEPAKQEPMKQETVAEDVAALLAATVSDKEEKDRDYQREQILSYYKQGKSIREISRELSMGQGEVKLVIDLYGA